MSVDDWSDDRLTMQSLIVITEYTPQDLHMKCHPSPYLMSPLDDSKVATSYLKRAYHIDIVKGIVCLCYIDNIKGQYILDPDPTVLNN